MMLSRGVHGQRTSSVRVAWNLKEKSDQEMASAQVQLPHNLQAILKEEDSQIDSSSERPKDRIECHARELTIYRGNDPTCWQWVYMPDTDGALVEVAVLLRIDRLDVSKVFSAKRLTPGKYYGVYFVLMMTDGEYGFKDHPVKFQLAIPNCHETIERKEDLSKLPKNKWTVVRLGEFATSCNMSGDLKISMFEQLQQVNPELNQDPIWLEIARLPIQ